MMDMFIAPEGAMQFEVVGTPSAIGHAKVEAPYMIWVLPEISNYFGDCPCETGFPVINTPKSRADVLRLEDCVVHGVVCTCMGRIIE